jgi:pimeloyl-ACP methyl ester carboxylesterase
MPVVPGFDGTARHEKLRSMADLGDLVAEFIDTVIKEPCDVVGHSFGGWVATWLAARHPDKVCQLVLAAPAGFRPEGVGGLGGDPETLRRRMVAHPENLPAETKEAATLAQNRDMPRHYHSGMPTDRDLVPLLGNIEAETLILLGTKDGIIPAESARLLQEKIPHAHLVYVFDAAHSLDTDQPERYAQLIGDFATRGEAFVVNWRSRAAV